jgi:hypothetical protein
MENAYQIISSQSSIVEVKIEHLTRSRFAARIGKPRVIVGQSLLTVKGVNLLKGKFLDVVTHLKIGSAEVQLPA